MPNIKTAVSLDESLFAQADNLAKKLHIPRSRLFSLALKEFIRRYENNNLLLEINKAYADFPDRDEQNMLNEMRLHQQRLINDRGKLESFHQKEYARFCMVLN